MYSPTVVAALWEGSWVRSVRSLQGTQTKEPREKGCSMSGRRATLDPHSRYYLAFGFARGGRGSAGGQLDTASPLMASDLSDSILDQITPF